jgi:hypothetical protein
MCNPNTAFFEADESGECGIEIRFKAGEATSHHTEGMTKAIVRNTFRLS